MLCLSCKTKIEPEETELCPICSQNFTIAHTLEELTAGLGPEMPVKFCGVLFGIRRQGERYLPTIEKRGFRVELPGSCTLYQAKAYAATAARSLVLLRLEDGALDYCETCNSICEAYTLRSCGGGPLMCEACRQAENGREAAEIAANTPEIGENGQCTHCIHCLNQLTQGEEIFCSNCPPVVCDSLDEAREARDAGNPVRFRNWCAGENGTFTYFITYNQE